MNLDSMRKSVLCELTPKPFPTAFPSRNNVTKLLNGIRYLFYPAFVDPDTPVGSACEVFDRLAELLEKEIGLAYAVAGTTGTLTAKETALSFLERLPTVKRMLDLDAEAIYDGDPAAISREEVILTYPGFFAISIYRIAHELYSVGVPLIPRMMTEYAHEKTGIDIHAGAKIGKRFCIDHGTGIVIGETTVIGDSVKLYQGVTLGAKSFSLDENGNPLKGGKRHPNIGSNVVIYANATILGGDTVVGDGSVIGGNVFLTHSVPAGSLIRGKE